MGTYFYCCICPLFYWVSYTSYKCRLVVRQFTYTSLEHNAEDVYSPLKRLLLYAVILTSMFAFLNLTSQKLRFYTYIGSRTMYVYLLHGLIIGIIRGFGLYPFKSPVSIMTYLFLIITSGVIVYLLSNRLICKWTNPIINLKPLLNSKGKNHYKIFVFIPKCITKNML